MKGVDAGDQYQSYYCYLHKTTKWPHRIFTHLLELAVVNSWILYKLHTKANMTLLQYKEILIKQLVRVESIDGDSEDDQDALPPIVGNQQYSRKRSRGLLGDTSRLKGVHTPLKVSGGRQTCKCCSTFKMGRGKRVSTMCIECGVYLCMDCPGEENCWWRFHNLEVFTLTS